MAEIASSNKACGGNFLVLLGPPGKATTTGKKPSKSVVLEQPFPQDVEKLDLKVCAKTLNRQITGMTSSVGGFSCFGGVYCFSLMHVGLEKGGNDRPKKNRLAEVGLHSQTAHQHRVERSRSVYPAVASLIF